MSRILLADHDSELLEGFERALTRRGFDVLTATNEHCCARHLCESAPKAWVLEPDVKGSWGWQLLIDQNVKRPPTVIVSRFRENDTGLGLYTTWMTKPISTANLVQAIYAAIDG